jgi:4'-phosphopantetheinyl transferase
MLAVGMANCAALCSSADAADRSALSEAEWRRATAIISLSRRVQFKAGRLLARQLIGQVTGTQSGPWEVSAESNQPPRVIGRSDLFLSLSHSDGVVACALSSDPVGIDVEHARPGRDVARLAEIACSPRECESLAALGAADATAMFYRIWTLKEAWLKRLGTGLDFALLHALRTMRASRDCSEALTWSDRKTGHAFAVAGSIEDLDIYDWREAHERADVRYWQFELEHHS